MGDRAMGRVLWKLQGRKLELPSRGHLSEVFISQCELAMQGTEEVSMVALQYPRDPAPGTSVPTHL